MNTLRHGRALLGLTVALLAISLPTQAIEYGFGTAVGSSDYDFSPFAETQRLALCYIDFNGDGVTSPEDPILLMTRVTTNGVCPSTLSTPSILLKSLDGRPAGTEVNAVDRLGGKTVTSLTGVHLVRYFEDGTDPSKFDSKDTLYLDLKDTAGSRVDIGDLRLSASGSLKAGTLVSLGDADLNRPLANIRSVARQIHDSNVVYKAGSAFYVNADAGAIGGSVDGTCVATSCPVTGDVGVESGDVRLNPKAVNPLSDLAIVLPDHIEIVQATVAPGAPFQVKVVAKNTGKVAGAGLIETSIADQLMDARGTPSIEPNGVATLVITLVAPAQPGTYTVKSGTYGDFLTVAGPASGTNPPAALSAAPAAVRPSTQGAPSLAPALLLGALFGLAVVLRRAP